MEALRCTATEAILDTTNRHDENEVAKTLRTV